MAGVIRAALDAHPVHAYGYHAWCRGCGWSEDGPESTAYLTEDAEQLARAHQAEVATTAVLEAVEWVLAGWLDEPQASRAMRAIAAALAGEG